MELEEYKKKAIQRLNKSIAFDKKENMYYACMGLIEETGEIVAELRKPLFKGNFHEKTLDIEEIKSELGDLMWYIALICKNTNIDMNQLLEHKESDCKNKREKLIQTVIEIGKSSGKIVEEYQKVYEEGTDKSQLIERIENQYANICELAENLDLTIDEILNENIRKTSSRYNEKGEANKSEEYEK